MGAQQSPTADSIQGGLSFLLGTDNVHVVVLRAQDLAQRNSIIDTVLKLSSLKNSFNMVYLAAPRLLGATIDASIFRSYGIGLLFFDERRIDEAVAPQPLQPSHTPSPQPVQDMALVTELATLKSMYFEMERNLTQLRDDLKALHEAPRHMEFTPQLSQIPQGGVPGEPVFAAGLAQGGALPSYFSNNPWLEVLSKRGRSENEPIAG
jgi:hypothetical protein